MVFINHTDYVSHSILALCNKKAFLKERRFRILFGFMAALDMATRLLNK